MRVATWNMQQVAPRKPIEKRWEWIENTIDPDVIVLTEAALPKTGLPAGWSAIWTEGGVGESRRWGTIIAGRNVEVIPISDRRSKLRRRPLEFSWPAVAQVAEVRANGSHWGLVVGLYGITMDVQGNSVGHGRRSVPQLLREVAPVVDKADRVVVAGDFNLWPADKPSELHRLGLIDLVEATASQRPVLTGCSGCGMGTNCGHMWTHRNGTSPNAAVQHLDYVFATPPLVKKLSSVRGGIRDFPEAWEYSDHAPVVAEFA
jgi:exonuclease III